MTSSPGTLSLLLPQDGATLFTTSDAQMGTQAHMEHANVQMRHGERGGSLVAEGRMCFEQSRAGEPESEAECEEHAGRNINYSAAAPLVLSSCASQEVTH